MTTPSMTTAQVCELIRNVHKSANGAQQVATLTNNALGHKLISWWSLPSGDENLQTGDPQVRETLRQLYGGGPPSDLPVTITRNYALAITPNNGRRPDEYDTDDSTVTYFLVGDRAYSGTVDGVVKRQKRKSKVAKAKVKATVVKRNNKYLFRLPNKRHYKVPEDDDAMNRVAQEVHEAQGNGGGDSDASSQPKPQPQPQPRNRTRPPRPQPRSPSPPPVDIDFGTMFAVCVSKSDEKMMTEIVKRKDLSSVNMTIVESKVYDKYSLDITVATPAQVFSALTNFAAAHTRCYARDIIGLVIYEVLYMYMSYHNVIITRDGIDELRRSVLGRCSRFKRHTQFLNRRDQQ